MSRKINKILQIAINNKASDIHLTNGIKPVLRVDGNLVTLEDLEICNPEILREYVNELLTEENFKKYEKEKSIDSSTEYNNTRFRVHIYRQKECDAFSLRLIPTRIPLLSELNLPPVIDKFTTIKSGLVLVTGTTGSGKSTTLASIIGKINKQYKKHIITIEDPIEFIHTHDKSIVNQREIGIDVLSFSDAVRSAMREDPDILLIGEMRDLDTITNAITMAETGHLVFGTLHTRSVSESVDRIIDVFPPVQQEQIRMQLANSIQGIISQELVPKIGGGRVPCCEIMIATDALRNLIREQASPNTIIDQLQMNFKKIGTQTKTQALAKLIVDQLITRETALEYLDSSEVETLNRMISFMS